MAGDKDLYEVAEYYDTDSNDIQFDELIEYFKGDISDQSLAQYIRYLGEIDFNPLADQPETSILDKDDFDLSDFYEWSREKARKKFGTSSEKRNSRNRFQYHCYLALRKYLKATEPEKVSDLPDSSVFTQPESRRHAVKLSREQVEKMKEEADLKLETAVTLMFYAGVRSFALLHLTPEWLEFKEDMIEVEIPPEYAKGQKQNRKAERTYLKPEFEELLKNYIKDFYEWEDSYSELVSEMSEKDIEAKPVFNFIEGSEKTYYDLHRERYHLNQQLKELARKSGLNQPEEISSHEFRRAFINEVYDSNKDLAKTSDLARHKSAATTDKFYLNRKEEEKKETYSQAFD